MNTKKTGFASSFKTPEAVLSIWKKKDMSDGMFHTNDRGTGHKEVVTSFIDGRNLTYKGIPLPTEFTNDNTVNLRLDYDDYEDFLDSAGDCDERLLHLTVTVTNIAIKNLTSKGKPVLGITFFGKITDIDPQAATLAGDDYTEEELYALLRDGQKKNRERAASARQNLMNNAMNDNKPVDQAAVGLS